MQPKSPLGRAVFNTSNLSGLAAIFLSYSLGSLIGTFIFALAVIVGTVNKYRSLQDLHAPRNIFERILNSPALTAQILMVGAGINFLNGLYDCFTSPQETIAYHLAITGAWFFGFLGDDAIRRNDNTNFTKGTKAKEQSLLVKTFIFVTRNPTFYFLITNMLFAIAILLQLDKEHDMHTLIISSSFVTITVSILGVTYGIYRGFLMAKEKINPEQANDGVVNYATVIANLTISVQVGLQGFIWVALSQIIYAISNIIAIYETRSALAKEKHF